MAYLGRTELKSSDIQLKASTTISGSSTDTVVLTWTAANEQSLILKVNGVTQHTDAYSIAGSPTTITLASGNFADGAAVEVVGINDIGKAIVPADSSVTVAKLATTGTPDGSKFLQDDMAWTAIAAGGGFAGVKVYTGDATWTKATREAALGVTITKVIVEVQGGGGGGGEGATGTYNVGGSAGGYSKKFIDVSSVTASDITVGGGGAGTSSAGSAGADGEDSSWDDTDVAHGGSSTVTGVKGVGNYSNYGTAIGGIATGGDINIQGGIGGCCVGKSGGDSMFGFGGQNGSTGNSIATVGSGYGSGGGGYYGGDSKAGAGGIVIVWEYQ